MNAHNNINFLVLLLQSNCQIPKFFSYSSVTDLFADFYAIQKMHFDNNEFSTIKAFQFGGIQNRWFVEIFLRSNLISSIEPNAFEGIKSIHVLCLTLNEFIYRSSN